jgi:squalene-hopene/tetraprenyl-beta-curcumene cyclase
VAGVGPVFRALFPTATTPRSDFGAYQTSAKEKVKSEVLTGAKWLKELQNNDGGFPTFSRGWGKLPFDQSCADLTGHGLLAVSAVLEMYCNEMNKKDARILESIFAGALKYLEKDQSENGSWLPLWFGNQLNDGHLNPVYGTARVVTYLKDAALHNWLSEPVKTRLEKMIQKGNDFLVSVQNEDGSWGGGKNIQGTIEETALAVSALISDKNREICLSGLKWMDRYIQENGFKSAPIGLYFASLWYDEKLYPVTAYLEALSRIHELS